LAPIAAPEVDLDIQQISFDSLLDVLAERIVSRMQPAVQSDVIVPRLMSIPQAAEYLGRTVDAVENMIRNGKLPTVRGDRRVQLDREDLDRWIEANKCKPI
jgi:excisionase family DNA binding protein